MISAAPISDALARVAASRTTAMTDRAMELRAAGRDIISLSVGEPDFATPPHVIAAAKAALDGLTVALAAELAPAVRVNCIAPSLTRSAMAAPLTGNDRMAEAIARLHPIPRLGEGDDSAALADFLLSAAAGWITGQVFAVDGGRSTLRSRG